MGGDKGIFYLLRKGLKGLRRGKRRVPRPQKEQDAEEPPSARNLRWEEREGSGRGGGRGRAGVGMDGSSARGVLFCF